MTREAVHSDFIWITLPDGCRLAARLWLPNDDVTGPKPAVLEYHPYRMRDGTAERDEMNHAYFASHGYAAVRVDLRGTGDSDGLMGDEYSEQEMQDGLDVIAWIAEQPWCDGNVGMFGLSWGGFKALQLAALQPPALKAVISCGSTDDRYADDCHYRGGCLLTEQMGWASTMLSFFSLPPSPAAVGEGWKKSWLDRLREQPFVLGQWLEHPFRDAFWRHGSVCEDFKRIEVPVLAAGGWMDAYRNAVPRLLANLRGSRLGIVGPWMHRFPHLGVPGPAIGFLQECVRWWDRWLKYEDNGVPDDGRLLVFIARASKPSTTPMDRQGRWVAVPAWPPLPQRVETWYLSGGRLQETPPLPGRLRLRSPQITGYLGGELVPMAWGSEAPGDQRWDDACSLTFDTAPLDECVELLGRVRVELTLECDRPIAHLILRLCDVDPDSSSSRITMGARNLAHVDDHTRPRRWTAGDSERIAVELDDIAYELPVGHRLRLSLSTCYWPLIWPVPEAAQLTVRTGPSAIHIPLAPEGLDAVEFDTPEMALPLPRTRTADEDNVRTVHWDRATGNMVYKVVDDAGAQRDETLGVTTASRTERVYSIHPDDPLSARMHSHRERSVSDELGRNVRTVTRASMYGDREYFCLEATLRAYEGEAMLLQREWSKRLPRGYG